MPVINGIRAVVVYDPATGDTAQIAKPVAGTFDFTKTPLDLGERGPMGNLLDQADSSAIRFQFLDDGTVTDQLLKWRAARTRVSLIAVGDSVCVQWYEKDHFSLQRASLGGMATGRADKYTFEMVRQGHGKHAIYQQANLLGHLAGLGGGAWNYTGSNGIADGYSSTGAGTHSWLNPNTQQIDHNLQDHGIYADIVFPIQLDGFNLKLTSDIVNLHSETSQARIKVSGRNFAGTQIVVDNIDYGTTGRHSVMIKSSASNALYTIRVFPLLTPGGITTTDIVGAKEPVLRVDNRTEFISN